MNLPKSPPRFFSSAALAALCLVPALFRLLTSGLTQPIGLLSDLAVGVLLYVIARCSPAWLRIPLVILWGLFQAMSIELFAALQRFPTWQDLHYLTDADFVGASVSGFKLSAPWVVGALLVLPMLVAVRPAPRARLGRGVLSGGVAALCLFLAQGVAGSRYDEQPVAARYNGLQWFTEDAVSAVLLYARGGSAEITLPEALQQSDLKGTALLGKKGRARNVLIVVLEGVSGFYYPELRRAMGVESDALTMDTLARNTAQGMLIPDFSVHSHQTIRGLYSILCGDYSKLSFDTPKAFELLQDTSRAAECLPAQLADHGWSTHYLQAAGLQFMAKDKVMETIGFQEVHGSEWFTEPNPFVFEWGPIDDVFFRGARKYISGLRKKNAPWMLTLLTVGTHQPYGVTDEEAQQYGSRRMASVAALDRAAGRFIKELRQDGVLRDTLVVITSDESHGSEVADWISSWGLGIVLVPEQKELPRIKTGGYGLVDVTVSVLDYMQLPVPPSLLGRSFFRDYERPRDMVSYTASKLRWLTEDNTRYECTVSGSCRQGKATSILGDPPAEFERVTSGQGAKILAVARALDNKLLNHSGPRVLRFARGEVLKLPEKMANEWYENLVGAQYLDFPAGSTVHVSVRVKAVKAPARGITLNLLVKEWNHDSQAFPFDNFPVLRTGEEGRVEFSFYNPKQRQSVSFFLVGEGKGGLVKLEDFTVTIDQGKT
ncbi:MAG: LTA synthase family protein [Desulfobulbus sp.]|nr:LTA synthase family protein [Desulfobulbus sp.]